MLPAPDPLTFAVDARPDRARVIVAVAGEVDMSTVGEVRAALDELLAVGWTHIALDLRDVTFIDSTGLSLLLDADRAARADGHTFELIDGAPAVERLLEVVGLSTHFRRSRDR